MVTCGPKAVLAAILFTGKAQGMTKEQDIIVVERIEWLIQQFILVAAAIPPLLVIGIRTKVVLGNLGALLPSAQLLSAELVAYVTLVVYLVGWVRGASHDLRWLREALAVAPSVRRAIVNALGGATVLVFGFLSLCWAVRGRHGWLFLALSLFFVCDWVGWTILKRTVGHELQASTKGSARSAVRSRIVHEYMFGTWKATRLTVGIAVSIALTVFGCSDAGPTWLALKLGMPVDLLLACLFLVVVFGMELWSWIKRWRLMGGLSILDDLTLWGYEIGAKAGEEE